MSAPRTIVGMSGGVDSSVAALLLRDQACEKPDEDIAGLFMKNWADDEAHGSASAAEGRMPGAADAHGGASTAGGRMPGTAGSRDAQDSASVAEGPKPKATAPPFAWTWLVTRSPAGAPMRRCC